MAKTIITGRSSGVNDRQYEAFVMDPVGPIRRDLRRRAGNVQAYQVRHAPRRTGKLVSTSRKRDGHTGIRPHVEVIIGRQGETDYLGYILYGTPAHEIRAIPNRPNAHLRFIAGGRIVYTTRVWHPGTRPNNFVRNSLLVAGR